MLVILHTSFISNSTKFHTISSTLQSLLAETLPHLPSTPPPNHQHPRNAVYTLHHHRHLGLRCPIRHGPHLPKTILWLHRKLRNTRMWHRRRPSAHLYHKTALWCRPNYAQQYQQHCHQPDIMCWIIGGRQVHCAVVLLLKSDEGRWFARMI